MSVVQNLSSSEWSKAYGGRPFTLADFVNSVDAPLVCIKFGAEWCVPCKTIAPMFDGLAKASGGGIACFSVDVEQSEDIAIAANVKNLPTFVFLTTKLTNGQLETIETINGADANALQTNFARGNEIVSSYIAQHQGQAARGIPPPQPPLPNAQQQQLPQPPPQVVVQQQPQQQMVQQQPQQQMVQQPQQPQQVIQFPPVVQQQFPQQQQQQYGRPQQQQTQQQQQPIQQPQQMQQQQGRIAPNDLVKRELLQIRAGLINSLQQVERLYGALQ